MDAVVRVKDSNDESPVIAVPNRTSIPEELPVGAIVTWLCDVSDADAGDDLSVFLDGKERERERNVLFNNALNTFYLRLYVVRHMVKDHSYSEKGNPLPPHRLLLSINSKGSFICTIPQTG